MDSFSQNKSSKNDASADHSPNHRPKPSSSELFSSAKVVADAAKSKLHKQEFDKAKAAGAAANLLNAASHYGKLEENKGFGKVVDKAEDYLHKYSQTTTTTTTTTAHSSGHSTTHHTTSTQESTHSSGGGGGHGKSGGGYGDYVKLAEGLLKKQSGGKNSEGNSGNSGGGYGEYVKLAGDFLKKH